MVHKKNATALALTTVKNEDQREFAKLVETVKSMYGGRVTWGGGIMGPKSQAKQVCGFACCAQVPRFHLAGCSWTFWRVLWQPSGTRPNSSCASAKLTLSDGAADVVCVVSLCRKRRSGRLPGSWHSAPRCVDAHATQRLLLQMAAVILVTCDQGLAHAIRMAVLDSASLAIPPFVTLHAQSCAPSA